MTKFDEKMKAMMAVQLPIQATTGEDGLPDIGILDQNGPCASIMTLR